MIPNTLLKTRLRRKGYKTAVYFTTLHRTLGRKKRLKNKKKKKKNIRTYIKHT